MNGIAGDVCITSVTFGDGRKEGRKEVKRMGLVQRNLSIKTPLKLLLMQCSEILEIHYYSGEGRK